MFDNFVVFMFNMVVNGELLNARYLENGCS